jgi:putative PIN family toxin of toxin-antitoxin system
MSGAFFGGIPGRVLSAWAERRFTLVISTEILSEYQRVGLELGAQRPPLIATWEPLVALIAVHATIVDAPSLPERVGEDPDDEMFLAAALASNTQLIVSGDPHLRALSGWQGIRVCTPRQFHDEFLVAVDS